MTVLAEISVIFIIAALVSVVMRLLKQPLIIGYIITGVLVGPYFFDLLHSTEIVEIFSKLGITALLFIVGLSLSPKVIKEVGVVSLTTGLGQVIFTSLIGLAIALILGYNFLESLYIAVALTFSSTIIILKLLSDKGDVSKLYGRISVGFLLVQDLVATIILVGISSLTSATGSNAVLIVFLTLIKGLSMLMILFAVSNYLFPKFTPFVAKSQELLFIFSLAWGMGIAILYHNLGLSMEIGALVSGVALSISPYVHEISSRLKPLRDFFIILFFILLGHQMVLENFGSLIVPVLIFSVFILAGNPLIVLILMNLLGYSKRTGFLAGLTVAQISEFSLILVSLGLTVGHVSREVLSMVTIVGVITIAGSTYLILYSEKIYSYFSKYLSLFELRKITKDREPKEEFYDAILFGYHRVGSDFVKLFRKIRLNFVVVDFNPDSIKALEKQKIPNEYGDAEDPEFLEELGLYHLKLAVSTIPDYDANALLTEKIRSVNKEAIIVIISSNVEEALNLYKLGASYVVMPHFLGAGFAVELLERTHLNKDYVRLERDRHLNYLRERKNLLV